MIDQVSRLSVKEIATNQFDMNTAAFITTVCMDIQNSCLLIVKFALT